MELWAAKVYHQNDGVQFLCVCVDSNPQVAPYFTQMFHFIHVINAHIPSRHYMPKGYGQLGCSGFIIVDRNVCFISRRTKPYLQHGELAFRDVENVLGHHQIYPTRTQQVPNAIIQCNAVDTSLSSSSEMKQLPPPSSVGVTRMDLEHQECTNAFNDLLQSPTFSNLQKLLLMLSEHFQHEEHILKQYKFGSSTGGGGEFSALSSHMQDHQRIISIGQSELETMMIQMNKAVVDC